MAETIKPVEGVAYTANSFDDIFVAMLGAVNYNPATMGPLRYNPFGRNTLAVTGVATPVAVASGDAIVNGKHYTNTASKDLAVASPAVSTRIDRVVLRIDYTASPMTCTAVLLAGAEGGAAPAVTQTDGTTWEVSLAQVSITTAGAITVTDERVFVADGAVDAATVLARFGTDSFTNAVLLQLIANGAFQADAGTLALFADNIWSLNKLLQIASLTVLGKASGAGNVQQITATTNGDVLRVAGGVLGFGTIPAASIADRTRTLFVPCVGGRNVTDATVLLRQLSGGWYMADAKEYWGYGDFYVPSDYVSTMTIKAVALGFAAGNCYCSNTAYQGAAGEAHSTHTTTDALGAVALGNYVLNEIKTLTMVDVAAGDYVSCLFNRDGTNVADTVNNTVEFKGWLVSYTADS